jgi:hypothetical protein
MQTIQFLSNPESASAPKAVAPVVHQASLTMAVASGDVEQDLLEAVEAGSCAAYAGQIVNKGCYDIKATISYLNGADCDSCTVDTLSLVDVDLIIPANSVFPLPAGFHQQIKVVSLDSLGEPVANTTEIKLNFYSSYQPACGGCALAIESEVALTNYKLFLNGEEIVVASATPLEIGSFYILSGVANVNDSCWEVIEETEDEPSVFNGETIEIVSACA